MAPFWHRWSYFLIINLSVFHLADKCFTITNLINLRIILFLEYRKTPETLRFRGISYVWTQCASWKRLYNIYTVHLLAYCAYKKHLCFIHCLLDDSSNSTRSYCTAALTDSETKTLLHSYRMNQLYSHLYVVARHTHLGTSR